MKVFISSVISGFEDYREAAATAIRALGHEVIRAEDFGASPDSPQRACLAGVREADIVIMLLGDRYGAKQESGLSATHEEYREARDRCDVLAFVQDGVDRDPDQNPFVGEIQDWASGQYTSHITDPEQLRDGVTQALHQLELARATGPVDGDELLQRSLALLPEHDRSHATETRLELAIASGPRQSVLRPSQLENAALHDKVMQNALFGEFRLLNPSDGTDARVEQDKLVVEQPHAFITLDEDGSIRISTHLEGSDQGLPVIIEEEVRNQIARSINYAAWLLEEIDPVHRLSHCSPVVMIGGQTYLGWRTRREHDQSPNQASIGRSWGESPHPVHLTPPHRPRAALRVQLDSIADDLTVLLRREFR